MRIRGPMLNLPLQLGEASGAVRFSGTIRRNPPIFFQITGQVAKADGPRFVAGGVKSQLVQCSSGKGYGFPRTVEMTANIRSQTESLLHPFVHHVASQEWVSLKL